MSIKIECMPAYRLADGQITTDIDRAKKTAIYLERKKRIESFLLVNDFTTDEAYMIADLIALHADDVISILDIKKEEISLK
ncbi:MAG: hypothetical protein ACOCUT_00045 [bacterium]